MVPHEESGRQIAILSKNIQNEFNYETILSLWIPRVPSSLQNPRAAFFLAVYSNEGKRVGLRISLARFSNKWEDVLHTCRTLGHVQVDLFSN